MVKLQINCQSGSHFFHIDWGHSYTESSIHPPWLHKKRLHSYKTLLGDNQIHVSLISYKNPIVAKLGEDEASVISLSRSLQEESHKVLAVLGRVVSQALDLTGY